LRSCSRSGRNSRRRLAILLDCEARACGGFDFRAGIEVLPPPAMFVDLGDFRYLSAEGPGGALSLLVSRSGATGFVQAIEVGPAPRRALTDARSGGHPRPAPAPRPPPPPNRRPPNRRPSSRRPSSRRPAARRGPAREHVALQPCWRPGRRPGHGAPATPAALGARLEADGRVVLDGLAFASGSADLTASDLAPSGAAALDALAAWLAQDPARRVAVVGHTDATGSLDANLALSRRRAQAVAARLEAAPGVSPAQVVASGAGFLAPRATNLTPEGREANRRVEAVALPPG
jgi:OOP family OmpA-OmpF porin